MCKSEFKNLPQKVWKRKNVLSILPLSSSMRPMSTINENIQWLFRLRSYGDASKPVDSIQDIL
jgi:hypothetical protein